MKAPMSNERLAEARHNHAAYKASHAHAASFACCSAHASADDVPELLAEVERLRDERKADDERTEYAINLIIALASATPCLQEKGSCITHDRYLPKGSDCPHNLARAFLAGTGVWSKS